MHDFIHFDKIDKFDQYLFFENKISICVIFNVSTELINKEMQKWSKNKVKKTKWFQRWIKMQWDIQMTYFFQSESTPSFVVELIFQDVYEMMKVKTRYDRERRQVQK